MNDEQLNKRIHEIMGIRWHSGYLEDIGYNYDFVHTWRGFGILWEFMQEHEYIVKLKFRDYVWGELVGHGDWVSDLADADAIPESLLSPLALAKAVEGFFEEK